MNLARKLIALFCIYVLSITISYADSVRILDNPQEALDIRLQMIKDARETIEISYFIFADDETSIEFLAALRSKLIEGVKVKLMVDSMFNDIPKYIGTILMHEGMEIKNFNKFSLLRLGKSVKYRMHDKMLIVDKEHMIMGGRNIEDTYYGKAHKNYNDRDIYIQGESALVASNYYNQLFEANHLTDFKIAELWIKDPEDGRYQYYYSELKKAYKAITEKMFAFKKNKNFLDMKSWSDQCVEVENVDIAFDAISSRKSSEVGTTKKLYQYLKDVRHTLIIDSPYLVITNRLKNIFKELISRGVYIRILTNSARATDGVFPQAAYLNDRAEIASMGIDLYEYYADDSFHSKSMVIDDEIAIIGSFNLDPRSEKLNTETIAVVHKPKVASLLRKSMDISIESAYKVDENGQPIGFDEKLPGISKSKKFVLRLIQYTVAKLFRGLL